MMRCTPSNQLQMEISNAKHKNMGAYRHGSTNLEHLPGIFRRFIVFAKRIWQT